MGFSALLHPHNRQVGQKLGLATLCMVTLPIASFYAGMFLFADQAEPVNWAGGMAIVVTNVVIAGYVYMAFTEPDEMVGPDGVTKIRDNDTAGPRVGFYKQRTE